MGCLAEDVYRFSHPIKEYLILQFSCLASSCSMHMSFLGRPLERKMYPRFISSRLDCCIKSYVGTPPLILAQTLSLNWCGHWSMMISDLFFGSVVASCSLFFSINDHRRNTGIFIYILSDCNVDSAKMWAFSAVAVIVHCSCYRGAEHTTCFACDLSTVHAPSCPTCMSMSCEQ